MTITQVKVHKYLRITIYYSSPGKLIFSMIDYIGKMLDNIPEYMKGESATPTSHHLFYIAEDATKLYQDDEDLFHNFVAQLLYISKRAFIDIQLAVSFLCTRVRGPDTYYYRNHWPTTDFSINKAVNIKCYFDAAFAVHKYMMIHTGGFTTMGTGGAYIQSRK